MCFFSSEHLAQGLGINLVGSESTTWGEATLQGTNEGAHYAAGRPWAQEYDPRGAQGSPRPHHMRVSDPAYADRPGAWWDHVEAMAAAPQAAAEQDGDHSIRHSVLPRAPWLPARSMAYEDSENKNGRHGCLANEMRYMPRTVWQ